MTDHGLRLALTLATGEDGVLERAIEYCSQRADCDDGIPNEALRLESEIGELLATLRRAAEHEWSATR